MKNLLLALCAAVLLFSCGEPPVEEQDTSVTITGTIQNLKDGEFRVTGPEDFEMAAPVAEDGTFSMNFELAEPGYYTMNYGGEHAKMYLEEGFNLHLDLNTEEFDESLSFGGEGAGFNNYLIGMYLLDEQFIMAHPFRDLHMNDPENFRAIIDSMVQAKKDYLQQASMDLVLPTDFVSNEMMGLDYEYYVYLSEYRNTASYYQDVEEEELGIPEDFVAAAGDLPLENVGMLDNFTYRRFVDVQMGGEARDRFYALSEEEQGDGLAFTRLKLEVIAEKLANPEVRDNFLHEAMNDAVSWYGAQDLTEMVTLFKSLCQDQKCIDAIEAEVDGWKSLWKGEPAPQFAYADMDGNTVALADLEGKVVYVDVWASWCGPCRGEIPHLKDLEHDYHGQNVEFVSVSIDEDEQAWRDMVQAEELRGVQLLADKAWESSICEDYKINGIPRFLLIGTEGKIVSADAPRPSSGAEIRDMIESAMHGEDLAGNH